MGHVNQMGDRRNTYSVLVGKHEKMKPPRRPGHRLEDNIRMHLKELGWGIIWLDLCGSA
jgi:hypothetical protein